MSKEKYFGMSPRIARWKINSTLETWLGERADYSEFWKKVYILYYRLFDSRYYKGGIEMINKAIEVHKEDFVGLDKIIEKRVAQHTMGFGASMTTLTEEERVNLMNKVIPDDLVRFGLIPELIGRMPISVALKELTKEDLKHILTEPKNSIIKQFTASFALDNVQIEFTDDAIDEIANIAIKHKTGARGLRAIVERLLLDIMFEVPSMPGKKRLVITKEVVNQTKKPTIECIPQPA